MTDENVDFQLVPPHVHRRNAAKESIRAFKNHRTELRVSAAPTRISQYRFGTTGAVLTLIKSIHEVF
jgi:hypothetical protein